MSIEALLSLLAFFSILSLFLSVALEQLEKTKIAVEEFKAIAMAKKCSLVIDSVFANPNSAIKASDFSCFQQEKNFISAKNGNSIARSGILAQNVSIMQQGNSSAMEVKASAHYQ